MHVFFTTVVAGAALYATSSSALSQMCNSEVVFDLSPFTPAGVAGEVFAVTTLQGEVVHARIDATFVSNEVGEWDMYANFDFPTGIFGIASQIENWSGVGTFETSIDSNALNGFLVLPDGASFIPWYLLYLAATPIVLPGGGEGLGQMDGYFEQLTLTLTLATCPLGDITGDYRVDVSDLLVLLASWGVSCREEICAADLNGDGTVDVLDLLLLLGNWGNHWCPPPLC